MILTHGANSIGRGGDQDYILDNFVALYNGVTDSGYAINDGSFGQLLWDANGPIQAPNGQGMPYYARENFSGNNGGVQAIYDGLKTIIANGIYTMDLWFYYDSDILLNNGFIFGLYNPGRGHEECSLRRSSNFVDRFFFTIVDTWEDTFYEGNREWAHLALVVKENTYKIFANGNLLLSGNCGSHFTDINTIRFRFDGSAGGVRISQFALRNRVVWTSNFTPPTLLYKQI